MSVCKRLAPFALSCEVLFLASAAFSATPAPVVSVTTNYNGYATVGGTLASTPEGSVGVSITNGNVKTNTVTDPEGRWSVVFQIRSANFSVESWSLFKKAERSAPVTYSIP